MGSSEQKVQDESGLRRFRAFKSAWSRRARDIHLLWCAMTTRSISPALQTREAGLLFDGNVRDLVENNVAAVRSSKRPMRSIRDR